MYIRLNCKRKNCWEKSAIREGGRAKAHRAFGQLLPSCSKVHLFVKYVMTQCQVHLFTWALYPLWLQFRNGGAHLQAVQGGSQRASVTSNWGVCSQFCPTVISSCSGNAQCTCSTCCICCLNMYCTCDTIYTYLSTAPKNLLCDIIFQLKLGVWLVLWMS